VYNVDYAKIISDLENKATEVTLTNEITDSAVTQRLVVDT
jgi:hypothetical protein